MINKVKISENKIIFRANSEQQKEQNAESRILPNTLTTRINQKYDKTTSAIIEYPAKGLTGHINSDFYEFLSMGIIPYLIGSGTFMALFNMVGKLDPKAQKFADSKGKKMALGVLLYGIGKSLTGDLVTRPVAHATGVDIELPYRNVYYPLPTKPGADAEIIPQHQQRKVYDSREFFRKDLIAKDPNYGVAYYDNIAKKLGLGEDLNDSVTETTPIIQNIISTTKTAKSLSTYAWAATGVALAMQKDWEDLFDVISNRRKHVPKPNEGFGTKLSTKIKNFGHNTVDISKSFCQSFSKACKSLWCGEAGTKGYMKHAGKAWILFSAALTIGSTFNVIHKAKHMGKLANRDLIDRKKESTVI